MASRPMNLFELLYFIFCSGLAALLVSGRWDYGLMTGTLTPVIMLITSWLLRLFTRSRRHTGEEP